MNEESLASLREEVSKLKKKLGVATVIGIIFGSGGLFGFVKWISTDRQLIVVETRLKTVETEIMKYGALSTAYTEQKKRIDSGVYNSSPELLRDAEERLDALEQRMRESEEIIYTVEEEQPAIF